MWDRAVANFFCHLVSNVRETISILGLFFTKKLWKKRIPPNNMPHARLVATFVTNMSQTCQIWHICLQTFRIFSVKIRIVFTVICTHPSCNTRTAVSSVQYTHSLQSTTCNKRTSVSSVQYTHCSLQRAIHALQSTTCNTRTAVSSVQYTHYSLQLAIHALQSPACNTCTAVYNVQYTHHSLQRQYTHCSLQHGKMFFQCVKLVFFSTHVIYFTFSYLKSSQYGLNLVRQIQRRTILHACRESYCISFTSFPYGGESIGHSYSTFTPAGYTKLV